MKTTSLVILAIAMAAISLFPTAGKGQGLTADQVDRAGYFCFEAGPNLWIHCLLERKLGKRVIPVKVFSIDGSQFLGTEQLLRDDAVERERALRASIARYEEDLVAIRSEARERREHEEAEGERLRAEISELQRSVAREDDTWAPVHSSTVVSSRSMPARCQSR